MQKRKQKQSHKNLIPLTFWITSVTILPAPWPQLVNYRLPLFPHPAAGPPRGPEMEPMLITVPGPPWSAELSDGSRAACWETQRRKAARARDDWWMRPSSLYLCIQAALCCSHSQWQEVEQKETRRLSPQRATTAGITWCCTCEALPLSDSAVLSSVVVVVVVFTGVGGGGFALSSVSVWWWYGC